MNKIKIDRVLELAKKIDSIEHKYKPLDLVIGVFVFLPIIVLIIVIFKQ